MTWVRRRGVQASHSAEHQSELSVYRGTIKIKHMFDTLHVMHYVYAYIASLLAMTVLDAVWLGLVAPAFYKKHIGFIMADKPNWFAAIAFYVLFVLGVTIFVVYPGWKNVDSLAKIALLGALFGLVTYATYDLTNHATLKNWPKIVTFVDLLWGTALTAAVSIVAVLALKALIK